MGAHSRPHPRLTATTLRARTRHTTHHLIICPVCEHTGFPHDDGAYQFTATNNPAADRNRLTDHIADTTHPHHDAGDLAELIVKLTGEA